jgi:hypothetical protein
MGLYDRCGVGALAILSALTLLTACGPAVMRPATPPGPGVPRIANLRLDPDVIKIGETTRMSFYFEVGSADIEEAYLIERGIREFQFFQDLQATPIDLRRYSGQVAATVEVPLKWSSEGVRFLELYVVTIQGNASNRLQARVTVR